MHIHFQNKTAALMKRNKDALKNALPRLSVTFYRYDLNQTVMLYQRRIPFQTYKLKQKYELSIFLKNLDISSDPEP